MVRSAPAGPPLLDPLRRPLGQPTAPSPAARDEATTRAAARLATPAPASSRPIAYSPILRSKVQPPPLRTSTLSRQRLLDRLASATQSRVTLITADAGYGKTTLLADFSRRFDGACVWYSLDGTDSDWVTVVTYLVAAIREVRPEFGEATTALLRSEPGMPPPKRAATTSLVQELQVFGDERTVLILDDIHTIDETGDAKELVLRLMRDAPRGFSFVLASRHRPSLSLARWGGMGELVELTTDDLRFSHEETARLFADSYGQPLEPDVVRELDSRTRGWPACLQLFSTLINGRSQSGIRAATESLSGAAGPVYEYLAQEVVAHLPPGLQSFLTRASLLQPVTADLLKALFPNTRQRDVDGWLAESDALGLLSRTSQTGRARQFHPLLREFLQGELLRRHGPVDVAQMHADVARAAESDPLVAAHHYIEAGLETEAMRCLGTASLLALGAGRWGTAAQLAEKLTSSPNGGVAAILGRHLLEQGDLVGAERSLRSVDVSREQATVRTAIRIGRFALDWRKGDSDRMGATLQEIAADSDAPEVLREMAGVYLDSSSTADTPRPLPELVARFRRMAAAHEAAGYDYYAAITLLNAAFGALQAGKLEDAARIANDALAKFERLSVAMPERHSVEAVLGAAAFERGDRVGGERYMELATASGDEEADVSAELSAILAVTGERAKAAHFISVAQARDHEGRTDLPAKLMLGLARGHLELPRDPRNALQLIEHLPRHFPVNLGYDSMSAAFRALCHLLAGEHARAREVAERGIHAAQRRGHALAEARLRLLAAMAGGDSDAFSQAIADAAAASHLALLEVADAVGDHLHLLPSIPEALEHSIGEWPTRWQPVLRRQLARGDDPRARAAANALDRHGTVDDVLRLRAYDRTYRQGRGRAGLGRNLSRRVSPRLRIQDLGRVSLAVGERLITLARTRRKPAALLMYLVTRPGLTATREQILEDLWPDGEPAAAANSLNQSLYFIRREIDPWYEDDFSPEYISYQAELVSLDEELVQVSSADFMRESRQLMSEPFEPRRAEALIRSYKGQFCPEFEYEEWAMGWRTRVHGAYLDFARATILRLAEAADLRGACDIALRVLSVDPTADDIERKLIWLYWRSGAQSAAEAHYLTLAARERADGLEPEPLRNLVAADTLA